MKRILLCLIITMILPTLIRAEKDRVPVSQSSNTAGQSLARKTPPAITTNALFDLKFDYVLPRGGFAGITWTHSEFWLSKWNSDSVFTVDDSSGALTSNFKIPTITGIRGMVFDGTHIWVANATSTIYKVDTLSKTVVSTITAPFDVRGIAYDSTANGGAGGLWIANYATDITLIDTAGVMLSSIFAATHGLTGMYSLAFDPYSTGGPYIWAFDQGSAGTSQNLVRIAIATGTPDVVHDVGLEIGGAGIAGGLTITGFAHPGPHTLVGLSQDSPDRIFGLELGDFVLPAFDASADTLNFNPPYTKTPSFLLTPISWSVTTTNGGSNILDTINANLIVNDGTTDVFTASGKATGVPSLNTTYITIPGTYTPPPVDFQNYNVSLILNTGNQTDLDNSNDSSSYSFSTTDTVMARNGARSSRIGIGNGTGGTVALLFEIPTTAYATSATFELESPELGDSVYAELHDWNGSTPNNLIAQSATYIITAADTDGVTLTLPFLNSPIQMTPGSYVAGIHEHNSNITISYSLENWRPGTCWINLPLSSGWSASENLAGNFRIVPFINLNIWSEAMISVNELDNVSLALFPNPTSTNFTIELPTLGEYNLTVTDISGKIIYSDRLQGNKKEVINTTDWGNGLYITRVESNGRNYFSKVIINH